MYTVKVHWTRHAAESRTHPMVLDDEMTHFIPADEVVAHGYVPGDAWQEQFKAWDEKDLTNMLGVIHYDTADPDSVQFANGRLIRVVKDGTNRWLLTSRAWLLNESGRTIERIAP